MGWDDWYKQYTLSPSLQARLVIVREQIAAALDQCPPGAIHIVSLCAGDGRDLLGALIDHPRRADVRGWLLDVHAESLARGQQAATAAGLQHALHFRHADAGRAENYADIPRADLILLSGFLGHLHPQHAHHLLQHLPILLNTGGQIIWNRHLVMNDGRQQVPAIRTLLTQLLFAEAYFQITSADGFAIGRCRFTGPTVPPDRRVVFFEFASLPAESPQSDQPPRQWIDAEQSIPACFEQIADTYPTCIALANGTSQCTFEKLNQTANAIAAEILKHGTIGDRVALLLRHDAPLIASILGVLKAGRVLLVLNASDPADRLERLLAHAEAAAIVVDELNLGLARTLAAGEIPVLPWEVISKGTHPNPTIPIAPADLAWLIYTSGSTGTPKAVMQSHRNILHNAMRNAQGLDMHAEDRVLLMASPSGGQGVGTIWCTLLFGATLCPFPAMERGVTGLADWMKQQQITVYVSAASIFRNFTKALDPAITFPGVRIVRLASEPATFDDFVAFRKHFGKDCFLLQTLSSSETGNITQCRMRRDDGVAEGRLPVGVPAEGMDILLLDDDGRPAADGGVGEIVVCSDYLSPGYWGNEGLTRERFMDGASGMGRRYRMGDQAMRMADGRLLFMGRKDNQIKLHGFRIEVSEVEAVLEGQSSVERAFVCASSAGAGKVQLVAYVVPRRGQMTTADLLRAALRSTLPGYMIPSAFVFLETFPLNASGKIDRSRLPDPSAVETRRRKARRPARDGVEKQLAEIWEQVLGLTGIGWDENFFDLGGDSLQALAIVARIEQSFGQLPPLSIFLDAGTIEGQAAMLCQGWSAQHSTLVPLQSAGDKPPLYCVHGAGGEVLSFSPLARLLGPDQPVWGLQSPGLLGEWPPVTIEEFARRQVREILQRDPHGPCSLLGHCAGGLLAIEIARQLAVAGKSVTLVALVDTLMPSVHPRARSRLRHKRFADRVAHRVRTLRWRVRFAFDRLLGRTTPRFGAPFRRFADYAFKQALRRYRVTAYGGPVVAFKANTKVNWQGNDARDALVRDFLPAAVSADIPGDHAGCLRPPHVETLAAALRGML